jgi:hypothetical protein
MRQGIAPWRGIIEAGVELADFFLIFDEPMFSGGYFLNKLSKAARAALALRGAGVFSTTRWADAGAGASRATVTIAIKNSQVLAWSFMGMRTGTGLWHWKRVDESKCTHCLQQCSAALHLGQFPLKSVSDANAVAQLKQR